MKQQAHLFLAASDELGLLVNNKANELYAALLQMDKSTVSARDEYHDYFRNHHLGNRLFFSIQNSAHILYDAILLSGKPVGSITAVDYGAGLGTLFMLGGMLGFKRFSYNDYFPEWKNIAVAVCKQLGIPVQDFITGGVKEVTAFAEAQHFTYDIVVSRNVIEHIYNLPEFYSSLYQHNPAAVIYSTTTANYHNPVMRWYHIYIHKKTEKQYYRQQRIDAIQKLQPQLGQAAVQQLAHITRGRAAADFAEAVNNFVQQKPIQPVPFLRSNVCDCTTGVWCEHLLTQKEYETIIHTAGYKMNYTAGYWDTHYASGIKNIAAKLLNRKIHLLGNKNGIFVSPFVNIVAYN
ncbi:MAG TPA: hypothetical protein PKC39_12245 [Ferruginibacter sp.]|nr:hypothetical protein [Ferruginibacter sp.]HMP21721.1 hypothetical protein [Ferruginibacter sp.]